MDEQLAPVSRNSVKNEPSGRQLIHYEGLTQRVVPPHCDIATIRPRAVAAVLDDGVVEDRGT